MEEKYIINSHDAVLRIGAREKKKSKIKGNKGVIVVKGKPAVQIVYIDCKTEEIANEIMIRLSDCNYKNYDKIEYKYGIFLAYKVNDIKNFRSAFKTCKNEETENEIGL